MTEEEYDKLEAGDVISHYCPIENEVSFYKIVKLHPPNYVSIKSGVTFTKINKNTGENIDGDVYPWTHWSPKSAMIYSTCLPKDGIYKVVKLLPLCTNYTIDESLVE